jgi:signal recognition particle subunit SRP72
MAPPTTKPAKKVAAKQPLPVPERLRRLFTSLCAQIDGGHFNNAIKTCDKSSSHVLYLLSSDNLRLCCPVLRLEPGDADAMQTKVFLLLQTEQYTTALSLIGDDSPQYAFEHAYSLYRLQREPDTTELLQTIRAEGKDDRGALHLQAQMVCLTVKHNPRVYSKGLLELPARILPSRG